MNKNIFFDHHLIQFFLGLKSFQIKVAEKIKKHFMFTNVALPPPPTPSQKSCLLCNNVKNGAEWGRPQMTIWCIRMSCKFN